MSFEDGRLRGPGSTTDIAEADGKTCTRGREYRKECVKNRYEKYDALLSPRLPYTYHQPFESYHVFVSKQDSLSTV